VSESNPIVPGSFAPGARIAGYLLEEQIGQGGMAVVFRAHDERLERTVALKILAPALAADEAFRQRFIRESRAAAAVDDPHIIPVFEAGEASGVLFIAMRYVRGGDVRSLVSRFGPLPPGRVAEIVSQVASALDAAHGRGLVHRDVKPANMLLDASSGSGRPDHVYLSDFGLSKGSLQASGLTGTGTFLGTLDYISPEQIEGKPVDGRADEYALACAAFELLTGVPPFKRDEAMAVMYAQLSEPPPLVTSRRPDLPVAIDAVFARALAKPPAERYGSCREFADALREAFGIRPYDSGPGMVPSGEHPATQLVRPSGPESADLAGGPVGAGSGAGGGAGPSGSGGIGGIGSAAAAGTVAMGGAPEFGGGSGPSGPQAPGAGAPGVAPGVPVGGQAGVPGSQGGVPVGGQATQVADVGHGNTSPDLTAAHWQGGGAGGYGGPAGDGGGGVGARPWWRSPVLLVVVIVVLLGGGGAAYFATKGSKGTTGTHHHIAATLAAPGCTTKTATASSLSSVAGSRVPVPGGSPFGIVASRDGKFVFAVTNTSVRVFSTSSAGALTYRWQYTIANAPLVATAATLTTNGKYMLVAAGNGIVALSVAEGESGASGMQVGAMTVPNITGYGRAISVAVSPDDKYAFVTLQYDKVMAVFNLNGAANSGNFSGASYVGSVRLGAQPVGITPSPDGKYLYVTSFQGGPAGQGLLNVLSVPKAETSPASSVIAQVSAGCNPARIAVSSDSSTVWVTTRQSNTLLAFSAAKLASSSTASKAIIAEVPVGQTPIGLALVQGGSRIVVADTDLNAVGPSNDNLAVLSTANALAGKSAVLGYIPSGLLPHEMTVSPNGQFLYVTDAGSAQIQVVDLSKLP